MTTKLGMTLPFSKDNYYFAVQAVSEDGNESLPVLPVPNLRQKDKKRLVSIN